jgi:hypothetical protein
MEAKNLTRLKTGFLFTLLAVALTAGAQNLEVPQKEFTIHFSKDRMDLSRAEGSQLDILILKSKDYQKSKIKMGVSSRLPKGVTVTFQPDTGSFDSTTANVSIQADATPGEYLLILSATLKNKTKGSILKLLIK